LPEKKKKEPSAGRLRTAFLLALLAGILMIVAGLTGSVGILGMAFDKLKSLYPAYVDLIGLVLMILTVIASLGGFAVIFGGVLVLRDRLTTGKLLIGLGAGIGLITLVVGLVSGLTQGWGLEASFVAVFATGQAIGWIGLFLSVLARMVARK
jgi:hypothetical protein